MMMMIMELSREVHPSELRRAEQPNKQNGWWQFFLKTSLSSGVWYVFLVYHTMSTGE